MQIFLPIAKVDVEKHTVHGRAVQEMLDKSGEVFDYDSSKPNFEKWSRDFEKVTDGRSLGNVRAMHGKVAAGKLTEVAFEDAEKAIDVVAHVVDEAEWKKCLEGVYTGFSIGGRYEKKWTDDDGLKRYTASPSEVSLVDAPCVPSARFTLVKADGVEEEREFAAAEGLLKQVWCCGISDHEHVQKDEARKCIDTQAISKVSDSLNAHPSEDYLDEGIEKADGKSVGGKSFPASDWAYVPDPSKPSTWKLRLTATPGGPPDARIVGAAVAALGAGFRGNKVEIPAGDLPKVKARVRAAWKKANAGKNETMPDVLKVESGELQKGMYGVARFAELIASLNGLAERQEEEAEQEGDKSPIPGKLKTLVAAASDLFIQMAQEETSELTEGDDVEVLSLSEEGNIEKIQFNAERFPALAKLTLNKSSEVNDVDEETLNKLLGERDEKLAKAETALTESNEKLAKAEEALTAQGEELKKLGERVEEMGKRAAPGKGKVRFVEKSDDAGDGEQSEMSAMAEKLSKMSEEERSLFLVKIAQRNPAVVSS